MLIEQILFEIQARVGGVELPLETYCELQIGDILILDQKLGDPFEVYVGEEKRFQGAIGLYGAKKAVKIL